jgi:hypothetical protein
MTMASVPDGGYVNGGGNHFTGKVIQHTAR